tara:strand:+ start:2849 stop:3109 length:261 start_codon:yes stop_codon:yes gene_type:complete
MDNHKIFTDNHYPQAKINLSDGVYYGRINGNEISLENGMHIILDTVIHTVGAYAVALVKDGVLRVTGTGAIILAIVTQQLERTQLN